MNIMAYIWGIYMALIILGTWYGATTMIERRPNHQEGARQKAIEKGYVLTATLVVVKQYYITRGIDEERSRTYCVYRYEHRGKSYIYEIYDNDPPQTITLYYLDDPKNAGRLGEIVVKKRRWWLRLAITMGIIICIAKLVV